MVVTVVLREWEQDAVLDHVGVFELGDFDRHRKAIAFFVVDLENVHVHVVSRLIVPTVTAKDECESGLQCRVIVGRRADAEVLARVGSIDDWIAWFMVFHGVILRPGTS